MTAPQSISVTPKPAQLEVPFWLTGRVAPEVGAFGVLLLPARLDREERTGHPALVLELVGDDALQAHRERGPAAPPSEEKAVEIDAVDEVRLQGRPERNSC